MEVNSATLSPRSPLDLRVGQRRKAWNASFRVLLVGTCLSLSVAVAGAQEAEWIWAGGPPNEIAGASTCFFRKSFQMQRPEAAEIIIAADDIYELYLNGRKIGEGEGYRQLDRYNLNRFVRRGRNVLAIKVTNQQGNTGAVVARVQVKDQGGRWVAHSTNSSWKTNTSPLPLWNMPIYNDRRWSGAKSFGPLGSTPPWDRPETVPVEETQSYERFKISREFQVERVVGDEVIGSAIACAFNEFGQLIVSQEGGPLMLLDLGDGQREPQSRVYCDLVNSCQGILPLNGDVYVTAQGPEGLGIYLLKDEDRNGSLEKAEKILPFRGGLGEHGPHGLVLGPDGMIYCVVGNHSGYAGEYEDSSPVTYVYEGDLLPNKMEDPSGHAVGIKAPGGVVFRMSLDGSKVELVASGLRNSYDLVFNREGELFTYDSDMESDLGMSWYRETRVLHVVPGAEFGWRSGWSKWPDYYVDVIPPLVETGRGSPTGMVSYNHVMFPTKYQNALFVGDWSEGRILAVTLTRDGAGYAANTEVFLQGEPLNVTDLVVGPDGAIYFTTGGRSTSGGVYKISWRGTVPESIRQIGDDLTGVIRQPQLQSAWARQRVAAIRVALGDQWPASIKGVALATDNPANYRTRAMDLMRLYGPQPDAEFLSKLARDQNEAVRAKAAELLGFVDDAELGAEALRQLLKDDDGLVRRKAGEALLRSEAEVEFDDIKRMLISEDRYEAYVARRLCERLPYEDYRDDLLKTENHRLFIQAGVAAMVAHPSKRTAYEVLARTSELMSGFISDRNFLDVLRLIELALERGEVDPSQISAFCQDVADEFPSGNSLMNRELVRILAYMKETTIGDRFVDYLASDVASDVDKVHVAMLLQSVRDGWTTDQRIALIDFLEEARTREGGGSYPYYVMRACTEFSRTLKPEDLPVVLANGHKWPNAAVGAFYLLPKTLDADTVKLIQDIDRQIQDTDPEDDAFTQLKIGIVAVLARSGDEVSMNYLREVWDRDPDRRKTVAMGLAQQPSGENWSYLVNSLGDLEEDNAADVLKALLTVDQRPTDPEHYRQLILLGLRLKDQGGDDAVELLETWTGEYLSLDEDTWKESLALWQDWFARRFPDYPPAELPKSLASDKWEMAELLEFLNTVEADEEAIERGQDLFVSAQCSKCHRYANTGESVGPDLTALARRFTQEEVLESILHPSQVISDQYQTKTISTIDGELISGLVTTGSEGEYIVLKSDGSKVTVAKDEVEEMGVSNVSSMPTGLLDSMSVDEIADLFAFLMQGRRPQVASQPARGSQRN